MNIGVLGLPRTGTSATYWLLQAALPPGTCCLFEPEDEPPWQAQQDTLVKLLVSPLPGTLGPPTAWLAHLDTAVIVHRDPRDRLISSLLFMLHWSGHGYPPLWEQAGFDALLRALERKERDPARVPLWPLFEALYRTRFGLLPAEALRWLALQHSQLTRVASSAPVACARTDLRYEDLISGRTHTLGRCLHLDLGQLPPCDEARRSIKRDGGSGAWRHWFTADDCAYFAPTFAPSCAALGYAPTEARALAAAPHIDPATSSHYVKMWVRVQRRARQHAAS